jgi:two-component system sensor histidine kinase BaeS
VIAVVVILAAAALTAFAVVLGVRLLPTVRLQLAALALCCVVIPMGAVLLSGWVMFHMGDDVKFLAVAGAAAVAAVTAGLLLGRTVTSRMDKLRHAAREFASGDLSARTSVGGPTELSELAESFNEMASQLSELFDSRSELVAWAGHDLRTPLASLKAMLEAVEDGVAQPEEFLAVVRKQVATLERLVEDLFEVAYMDIGALTLDLREAEVASIVNSCVADAQAEAQAAGIRLESDTSGPAVALCAPEKVERVLRNLLSNALRHTPADGAVVVSVGPDNGYVKVVVEDTGEGLPADGQRRIFDRFWRGDVARTRASAGAGLGLTIARGLVAAQGGNIWAKPRPSGGTEVGFTLRRS